MREGRSKLCSSVERLSWNASWPMPFESAWSYLIRGMVTNHLAVAELIKLVEVRGSNAKEVRNIKFLETNWLDLRKLSEFLGVEQERLKEGFLSYFDLPSGSEIFTQYSPRFCRECLNYGYHCVLFDLRSVVSCPWHLTPISTASVNASKTGKINSVLTNDKLSHDPVLEKFVNAIRAGAQPENPNAIRSECVSFIKWWSDVRAASQGKTQILNGLFLGKIPQSHMVDNRSWQLGYAVALADRISPWQLDVSPTPVRFGSFSNESSPLGIIEDFCRTEKISDCSYKSLRNYFLRRYIRKHRSCLSKILSLDRDELCALRADRICYVALTYFLWRISIEGVDAWRPARKSKSTSPLRLMSPIQVKFTHSNRLRWSYYGFFGILHALSSATKGNEIIVTFRARDVCDGRIAASQRPSTVVQPEEETQSKSQFDVLYPFEESDLQSTNCLCKKFKGIALIHENAYFNQSSFSWSFATLDQTVCRVVPQQGRVKSALYRLFL